MTLIEVVVAMALLASGVVGAVAGFDRVANATAAFERRGHATALAEREVESLRSMAYDAIGLSSSDPGYVAAFEGHPTVRVADAPAEPVSTEVEEGTEFTITRHVTWADLAAGGTSTPNAYKRLTVIVTWEHGGSVDRVRLDSGVSPMQQPERCARRDTDGAPASVSGVVNRYYVGASSVAAGALAIAVTDSGRGTGAIAAGNLLLVVQMGGGAAGTFEYVMATSGVLGGVVGVTGAGTSGGLLSGYDAAGGFQVVRVPTYASTAVGALTGPAWDGSTGGVVAVDVAGTASLTGGIDVRGLGFTASRPGGWQGSVTRMLPGGGGGGSARGGGMVLLRTSAISGTSTIDASGRDGGSVLVTTESGGLDGLSISSRGQGGGAGGTVAASSLPAAVDVGAAAPGAAGRAILDVDAGGVPGIGVGVGCRPALGIAVTTSTPQVTQTGAATAVYSLVVTALGDRPAASGVTIESYLPVGLTHSVTSAVALTGGATRDAISTPPLGAERPSWGSFTIPAGGTVTITFVASVGSGLAPSTLQHGAVVRSASSHGASAAVYLAAMSTADDVVLVAGGCSTPATDAAPPAGISGVVNTYHPGTASVAAGATSVPVGAASGAPTPIAAGDVVLIMQVQGATIDGTNSADYGDGAGGDTARGTNGIGQTGRYEYAVATGPVTGGRLPVSAMGTDAGLVNSYVAGPVDGTGGQRRFQVVRVPTYPDVRLGAVTALAWNGSVGGVVAVDVAGTLDLHGGTISASAAGFRGAGAVARTSNGGAIASSTGAGGGAKGEGIAGTPRSVVSSGSVVDTGTEGLPGGGFGTGAPGNAGGGGGFKAGGGGGANGGDGGDGGKSPGDGDGGSGGADVSKSDGRLVLGGGGGATQLAVGQSNRKGHGGAGGGAVLLRATTLTGSGRIEADGAAGQDGMAGSGEESGGGGGGAGGSVLIASGTTSLASLAVSVNGGAGGSVATANSKNGSGGGGGGGTVRTTTSVSLARSGGAAGNAANAARRGDDGTMGTTSSIAVADVVGAAVGPGCRPLLRVTVAAAQATVPRLRGQEVGWTVTVTNLASHPTANSVSVAAQLPTSFGHTRTEGVTLTGGAQRTLTTNPAAGASSPAWGTFDIPAGGSVVIAHVATPSAAVSGVLESSARAAGAIAGVVVGSGYRAEDGTADDVSPVDVTTEATGVQATDLVSSATARVTVDELWAADAAKVTTGSFGTTTDAARWIELPLAPAPVPASWSPVASGASVTAAVRFGAPTAGATVCLSGSIIAAGSVVGSLPAAGGGPACVTGTTPQTTTVALPARTWTNAELRSLAFRLLGTSSAGGGVVLDQARVDVTLHGSTLTMTPVRLVDASGGGSGTVTWTSPMAVEDAVVVTAGGPSAIASSFASTRYVDVAFPASVPSAATVSAGSLVLRTQAVGSGAVTLCWWAEIRNGATVVGTIGSTAAPVCNASAASPSTQTVALPALSAAQVNGATLRWYPRIAAGTATGILLDRVALSTTWSRP